MRRNVYAQAAFLLVIVFLIGAMDSTVLAGGIPLFEGCKDKQDQVVETEKDSGLYSFAKVVIIKSNEVERYKIQVNPTRYYLSRETQAWLYFRQCAHINLNHQTIRVKNEQPNLREEKEADCWAIKQMKYNTQYNFSQRQITKIHRDIEMLEQKRERWLEVFGGSRRKVFTHDCLH